MIEVESVPRWRSTWSPSAAIAPKTTNTTASKLLEARVEKTAAAKCSASR